MVLHGDCMHYLNWKDILNSKKHILLIYPEPDVKKNPRFGYSLNLLYLASLLKGIGYSITAYVDYSLEEYSSSAIDNFIENSDIIIVEFDSFSLKRSTNISHGRKITEYIKENFIDKTIIAFGHDLSLFERQIESADYSFSSVLFEYNILQLLNPDVNNLTYDSTNEFDMLPFPDRSMLTDEMEHGGTITGKTSLEKSAMIQTSKGCENNCAFCQRRGWYKNYLPHSGDYVFREFQYLKDKDYKNVWISDDNFTFNLKRAKEILEKIISESISSDMKISCSSWTYIDKEFLQLAKEANVTVISFGIESVDRDIQKFYKKEIDIDKVFSLIEYADSIGIYTVGNFIIGAPGETEETISKSFTYAMNTPFDQINIKILDYMAGSELYESLPPKIKKNRRHVFACKENELNNYSLKALREKIGDFKNDFNNSRRKKMKTKMMRFGEPYYILS